MNALTILRRFAQDESGQVTSEYVLLIALIIIPIATVFNYFRGALRNLLDTLNRLVIGPGV